jgi:hypothetical protein
MCVHQIFLGCVANTYHSSCYFFRWKINHICTAMMCVYSCAQCGCKRCIFFNWPTNRTRVIWTGMWNRTSEWTQEPGSHHRWRFKYVSRPRLPGEVIELQRRKSLKAKTCKTRPQTLKIVRGKEQIAWNRRIRIPEPHVWTTDRKQERE